MRSWTTEDFAVEDRFDAWDAELANTHLPWVMRSHRERTYSAWTKAITVDRLAVVNAKCEACAGERQRKQIKSSEEDYYGLLFFHSGHEHVTHGDDRFDLTGQQILLWDSEKNVKFDVLEPVWKYTLMVPKTELNHYVGKQRIPGTLLDATKGKGALLANLMNTVVDNMSEFSGEEGDGVSSVLLGLIAQTIGRKDDADLTPHKNRLLKRVQSFVNANLRNPNLSPQMVANDLGISTRYLHTLHSGTGQSFGEYVRSKRLRLIRSDLGCTSTSNLSISQIAYHYGFNNASHFSRIFREAFGTSAIEYRKEAGRAP